MLGGEGFIFYQEKGKSPVTSYFWFGEKGEADHTLCSERFFPGKTGDVEGHVLLKSVEKWQQGVVTRGKEQVVDFSNILLEKSPATTRQGSLFKRTGPGRRGSLMRTEESKQVATRMKNWK